MMSSKLQKLLNPKTTALMVIDKQSIYFKRYDDAKKKNADLKKTAKLLDAFIEKVRNLHIPIIWTQMLENPKESAENIRVKMKLSKAIPMAYSNGPEFDFYGEVAPIKGERVIIKKRYDAFSGTGLDKFLKSEGIKSLILTGGYGSRCVLANAFAASGLGYHVFIVKDLVANPELFKEELPITLQIVDDILGYTVKSGDILKTFGKYKLAK